MPTIDQLQPVVVASDDDVFPVSQSGTARRVTRSQLLAGMQTCLTLTPGLLGRTAPGLGPPQPIFIGEGLSLANGILSGPPPYSAAALPISNNVSIADLVPIGQNGSDHAVSVHTLLSTSGIDISKQVARAATGLAREVGEWLGDAVTVEGFGAVGDGITDDTAAFNLAISSGRPLVLGPKTYRVDGQWNVHTPAALIGAPGITTIRRTAQIGGAWISISAARFTAMHITFDAGGLPGDTWGVLVAPDCVQTNFQACRFLNTTGARLGTGLTVQARDGLVGHCSTHTITNCVFEGNACHGLWIQAASGADVRGCLATQNGQFGICLDFNDAAFQQKVRQSSVVECKCINNTRGISIGNYNATNLEPPRWSLEDPDAVDIHVSANVCSGNTAYGIAISGLRVKVIQNRVVIENGSTTASGILCNSSLSNIEGNIVVGPGEYGIDAGGSSDLSISTNIIQDCSIGINAGGSTRILVSDNKLLGNHRAITIFQVETDGNGSNFGLPCTDIWIEENIIQVNPGSSGISLFDGPERVSIARNRFIALDAELRNLLWAHTDSVLLDQNTWNGSLSATGQTRTVENLVQLVVPEVLNAATVPPHVEKVDAIVGCHQSDMGGVISFVRVGEGGSGYTRATVLITGDGSGASATAYVRDGVVIGIALKSGGNGYRNASATIVGDGLGATAMPFVGVATAAGIRLTLHCLSDVLFTNSAAQMQVNWTGVDIVVPARTDVLWESSVSGWNAIQFSVNFVRSEGDGSVSVRSTANDIKLRLGTSGSVRICSDEEPLGARICIGRGSPEGAVIAPPGSDYRNLNGEAGNTLWLKRAGNGSSGWFAVA